MSPTKTERPEPTDPIQRYSRFLPALDGKDPLSFGLQKTELYRARRMAHWLAVEECYLKLELTHPTGTIKDRIIEATYSIFNAHGVVKYAHCSAGNTGTSLVWGMNKMPKPFALTVFIPGRQLAHHNFAKVPELTIYLVENANYEEAKRYSTWYMSNVICQAEQLSFNSEWRRQANKIAYLEAYEQVGEAKVVIDLVVQAISDGTGLVAAEMAARDAIAEGWLKKRPGFVAAQPAAANPIVRCFQRRFSTYDSSCTLPQPEPSRAFAIRRTDAQPYYRYIYDVIKDGGNAVDATEEEIKEAKQALQELENIEAGYTACTSLAAIRKENQKSGFFKKKNVLVMLTGIDRATEIIPQIDRVISEREWRKVLEVS
jgi:threonine synthase